jgi:hypothetical protein
MFAALNDWGSPLHVRGRPVFSGPRHGVKSLSKKLSLIGTISRKAALLKIDESEKATLKGPS